MGTWPQKPAEFPNGCTCVTPIRVHVTQGRRACGHCGGWVDAPNGISDHGHEWSTRYVTFDDRYDCASGMKCKCGARLDQDTVEELVNAAQPTADYDAEGYVLSARVAR